MSGLAASLPCSRYPAFGGGEPGDGYPVEFRVDYPERLSRLTTFFRGILIIPAAIVWYVLNLVSALMAVLAWFAIVITGRLPAGLAGVLVFCTRYHMRVLTCYWLLTDRYPWFEPASDETGTGTATQECPSCGRSNPADAAFCVSCGAPLS